MQARKPKVNEDTEVWKFHLEIAISGSRNSKYRDTGQFMSVL